MEWRKEFEIDGTGDTPGFDGCGFDFETVRLNFQQGSGTFWTPGNYTKQGYSVSYIVAKHLDFSNLNGGMKGLMHGAYYNLDLLLDHDMDVARKGAVTVEDFSGASFKDILAMVKGESKLDMKKVMDSIQNHLPQRMAAIILVNAPWYVRFLVAMVRPMLKPKLRKKIHVVSTEGLSEWFTPEQLPTIYGGQFELNNQWQETLWAHRTTLSEGRYVDPSPKSEEMIAQMTGIRPSTDPQATPSKPL
jgi:hypothetical protein